MRRLGTFIELAAFLCCGAAASEVPESPRLIALQRELAAGNHRALDDFWREIQQQGTPLVERTNGDQRSVLVTFLWRAKEDTKNVVVVGGLVPSWGFTNRTSREQIMARLLDTDLWYKTYRTGPDARFTYLLSPNDLQIEKDGWGSTWKTDPLNPHRYVFIKDPEDRGSPDTTLSMTELPGAPLQPWIKPRPDIPHGNVEMFRLKSKVLSNERRLWVYTPPGYRPASEPYGVLIVFDGWEYSHWIPTPTILDNLISMGNIGPLVALMVDTVPNRGELACYAPFVEFLTQELLPWAHQRYNITTDPNETVVAGSSLGGLAAAFCGLRRPDVFGKILSQSGAFWWKPKLFWSKQMNSANSATDDSQYEWLARQFVTGPKPSLRFYLDVGLLETAPARGDGPSQLMANRHMRDILQAKGYPLEYAEFNGRHEYLSWQGTLSDGLSALIGRSTKRLALPLPEGPASRKK